jgi:hypothetical protein
MQILFVVGLAVFVVLYVLGAGLIARLWWRAGRASPEVGEAARLARLQSTEHWSASAPSLRDQQASAGAASPGSRRARTEPRGSGDLPTPVNLATRAADRRREARTPQR